MRDHPLKVPPGNADVVGEESLYQLGSCITLPDLRGIPSESVYALQEYHSERRDTTLK